MKLAIRRILWITVAPLMALALALPVVLSFILDGDWGILLRVIHSFPKERE